MTNEPIAYAAVAADGSESVYVTRLKEQAEACCNENGWFLVPLYAAAPESWQLVHENERLRDEIARLRLTDSELRAAVRALLDGVNARYPDKNPREWTCPHMAALDRLVPPSGDE